MPRRFIPRDFWRGKKQSLGPNQHNRGDTSPHRSVQEDKHQRQNDQENEDSASQDENKNGLAKKPFPIRSDNKSRDTSKIIEQELWKTAFSNLEHQNIDVMKQFKELMMMDLNGRGHSMSSSLNTQDGWDIMEIFISRQAAGVLESKQTKFYNGLDQAFRVLKGIIEMVNEHIKLIPQATAPWIGVNIAVKLISQPVIKRKEYLDGTQTILEKLRWYQGTAGYLFQNYEEEPSILQQRELLREKMIDYFQRLLLYQIRSILLLHTKSILAAFSGAVKLDDWDQYMKEIQNSETDLDNRIEQFEKRKEREKKNQLQTDKTRNACLNALGVPDPRYDRKRILRDKGGLVPGCCDWIRPQQESEQGIFLDWLGDPGQNILWITGKAGKGKTMLMCDLIQWLEETSHNKPLFYFFCEISKTQTTDYNATAIRGLIYAIVSENERLTHYIQAKWEKNNNLFKDANVQLISYEILKALLTDDLMKGATIFIDALDECGTDLDLLFEIIKSTPSVKWVISSRSNTNFIDEKLFKVPQCRKVSLDEMGNAVSAAVTFYIKKQVQDLKLIKRYEDGESCEIERYLMTHSEGTFLWAALACKELWDPDTDDNDALEVLKSFPRGLDSMYERMMQKIQAANEGRRKLFEIILSINLVVSRSVTLEEFLRLVNSSTKFNLFKGVEHLRQMVEKCGHFFTISHIDQDSLSSGSTINFVHSSAKDYLLGKKMENIPLPGINYDIFEQCVKQMRNDLKQDMLSLKHPGAVVPKEHSRLNWLNSIAYACTSWAEHIKCFGHADSTCNEYETLISEFLRKHFLHWMEALSLLGKLPVGALALYNIKIFTDCHGMRELSEFIMDAYRFSLTFQTPIEQYPLQVYASALLFSPTSSHIRTVFAEQVPKWATIPFGLKDQWPSHLHMMEGLVHRRKVRYSEDGFKLIFASESDVDIRDTISSTCLQRFHLPNPNNRTITHYEISIDGTKVAWKYCGLTLIKILDIVHGTWVDIAESHKFGDQLIFSKSGDRLASHSLSLYGGLSEFIEVWDTRNGSLISRIPILSQVSARSKVKLHLCFLGDSTNLASVCEQAGEPIQIWCTESGQLKVRILQESNICTKSLQPFLKDSSRLVSVSDCGELSIWDTGLKQCVTTFSIPLLPVNSATISPDGDSIALLTNRREGRIHQAYIWNLKELDFFQLEGSYHGWMTFSDDSKLLAIQPIYAFPEVWIWDIISRTVIYKFDEDKLGLGSVIFSPDGRFVVFNEFFDYIKIWDISAKSSEFMETTEGMVDISVRVSRVSFSRDGKWLALVSKNGFEIALLENTGNCEPCVTIDTYVESIAFSEDGSKFAFGASDGDFGVTDLPCNENASLCIRNSGTDTPVEKLQFSRDDSLLAVVQTSSIRFFNIETGQYCKVEIPKQPGYGTRPARICAVKFYDNQLAVSILSNGNIHLWNPITGVSLKEILTERPRVMWGMFSAAIDIRLFQGSLQIITTSDAEERALHIIDVDTEKRIRTFKHGTSAILEFRQDNNTIIHSDRGSINLDQFDLSLDQITAKEESIVYQGYGKNGSWVTKNGQPMIWIPPKYQGLKEQCAISKSQIAIACYSGHLLLIDFLEEAMTF